MDIEIVIISTYQVPTQNTWQRKWLEIEYYSLRYYVWVQCGCITFQTLVCFQDAQVSVHGITCLDC